MPPNLPNPNGQGHEEAGVRVNGIALCGNATCLSATIGPIAFEGQPPVWDVICAASSCGP